MSTIKQKDAVFSAVTQVLSEAGIKFEDGSVAKNLMNDELRAQVNQILFEGFRAGTIEIKGEKSETELKQYVSGLQSNWLNKDKRLNGFTKYVPKNPGSRTGITDPAIKAMRALMASKSDPSEIEEIQGHINNRLTALKAAKVKTKQVAVNYEDLPVELQAKYSHE